MIIEMENHLHACPLHSQTQNQSWLFQFVEMFHFVQNREVRLEWSFIIWSFYVWLLTWIPLAGGAASLSRYADDVGIDHGGILLHTLDIRDGLHTNFS